MKQQLQTGIIFSLLVSSLFTNAGSKAYAVENKTLSDEFPTTTVREWRERESLQYERSPISQLNDNTVVINQIEFRSTTERIEIILNASDGVISQSITSITDNSLIIDLRDAQLELPEGEFVRENPVDGIASVTAIDLDTNTVRVTVTGITEAPAGEIIQNSQV